MKYSKLLTIALLLPAYNLNAQDIASDMDKISYSLGLKTGQHYRNQSIALNTESFQEGVVTGLSNNPAKLSEQEMNNLLAKLQQDQQTAAASKDATLAEENLAKGKEFLEKNKTNKDIIVLPSGLQYKVLASGKGESPKLSDAVTANYKGTLIDGTEFDSSYKRNQPATFVVGQLIKGWQEALQLMKPGDKWQLFIPAELAYGDKAAGPIISPNSTLVFELELLKVGS